MEGEENGERVLECCQDCGKPRAGSANVDGVVSSGFLPRLENMYNDRASEREFGMKLNRLMRSMKERVHRDLDKQMPLSVLDTVQLLQTLFEVAAVVSAVERSSSVSNQAKLHVLHKVALNGMRMIDADEPTLAEID